jgi:glutamyl-tRNA synthetase
MNKVVTRFAPSPTGFLHAGNYRTALFSYIFAKKNEGKFLLRIEDSDKARSKKEYEDNIIESLKWLGLDYDGFERQSEHLARHKECLQKLIDSGKAYISDETLRSDAQTLVKAAKNVPTRSSVIRFKNPNKRVRFNDLVRGEIEFDTTDLGDFVIARSMDEPVFHLVVVIDDNDMGITHVIRGEDHISNTPRQILIAEALGFDIPKYAHIPLLLASDRSKLSKRKGAKAITEYRDAGYLPAALVNYLALLGWNPGDDREVMSLDEIVASFDLAKVQKAGAIFDEEKLKWMNRQYMGKLSNKEYLDQVKNQNTKVENSILERSLSVIRDRAHTFGEISDIFDREGELGFVIEMPAYDAKKLLWKGDSVGTTSPYLEKIIELLNPSKDFSVEEVKNAIWPYAVEKGKGNILWPMRFALTGRDKSPDPFICASILGKEETIKRLQSARTLLG